MTVNELLEQLTEIAEAGNGDLEVLLASQPSWPLAATIRGVVEEDSDFSDDSMDEEKVVWLVEGSSPRHRGPYAPKELWGMV